jgi:hypothetical protein
MKIRPVLSFRQLADAQMTTVHYQQFLMLMRYVVRALVAQVTLPHIHTEDRPDKCIRLFRLGASRLSRFGLHQSEM